MSAFDDVKTNRGQLNVGKMLARMVKVKEDNEKSFHQLWLNLILKYAKR